MKHGKVLIAILIAVGALVLILALILWILVIHARNNILDGPDMMYQGYVQISQEQALQMMESGDALKIVDVRTEEEYKAGHIPGAILIPNESIGTERPEELPDLNETILVYCRSGRRSVEAAKKLGMMGYRNVYEFGGILTWKGETVKEEETPVELHSEPDAIKEMPVLVIEANGKRFYATFERNSSAEALIEKITSEPLALTLSDYGNFEKVGELPYALPQNDTTITTSPGDVILYQGDKLTIYYDTNTWSFTRIAQIGNATKEALLDAFGDGDVTVTLSLEWSE